MQSSRVLRARRPRDRGLAPAATSAAFLTSRGRCEACPSIPPRAARAAGEGSLMERQFGVEIWSGRADLNCRTARALHEPPRKAVIRAHPLRSCATFGVLRGSADEILRSSKKGVAE